MSLAPYPICELITQDVLAAVARVTVGNGYHFTLTVQRWQRPPVAPGAFVCVLDEAGDTEPGPRPPFTSGMGPGDAPYKTQEWMRRYNVLVYVFDSDLEPTAPYDQFVNVLRADVEKAVLSDRQRGGLAIDTFPRGDGAFADANDVGGVAVMFDVLYRTDEADPYTQA